MVDPPVDLEPDGLTIDPQFTSGILSTMETETSLSAAMVIARDGEPQMAAAKLKLFFQSRLNAQPEANDPFKDLREHWLSGVLSLVNWFEIVRYVRDPEYVNIGQWMKEQDGRA